MKNLIANAAKDAESRRLITCGRCGIFKAPMYSLGVTGKRGTLFVRVVTNRDDVMELLPAELVY